MVQKPPFSGNTRDLSADPDRSRVNTVRPEFCYSEFVIAIIEHVCCRHGQQMGAREGGRSGDPGHIGAMSAMWEPGVIMAARARNTMVQQRTVRCLDGDGNRSGLLRGAVGLLTFKRDGFSDRHGFWGYIQTSPRAFWDPMATNPFSEASYCKVLVPRPTHKRGRQSVAHDREPVERAAFRGSDRLEPPKSVTVRKDCPAVSPARSLPA